MNRDWAGHRVGDSFVVLGNYLTGAHLLDAMEKSFTADPAEDLEERLMRTIEAGRRRGRAARRPAVGGPPRGGRPALRTTWICGSTCTKETVGELRRVFDAYRPAIPCYNLRQVDARVPPLPDWLREHRR